MEQLCFSIIIPVLNSGETLRECLDSVLEQTYRDIEIICVYDHSTDESLSILQHYLHKDSRVRVEYGRGINLSAARNTGMTFARGEYLLFLDADDRLTSDACAVLAQKIRETPRDIFVFGFHIAPDRPVCPGKYVFQQAVWNVDYPVYSPMALFHELGAKPYVWRNCYRREMLEQNHLQFDEQMFVGEDLVFQMESFPFAENGLRFLRQRLYEYRWCREGSLQNIYDRQLERKLRGHIQMVDALFQFWKERKLPDKEELNCWAIDFLAEEIPDLPKDLRLSLSAEALAILNAYITEQEMQILPNLYQREYVDLIKGRDSRSFFPKQIRDFFRYLQIYGLGRTSCLLTVRLIHGIKKIIYGR